MVEQGKERGRGGSSSLFSEHGKRGEQEQRRGGQRRVAVAIFALFFKVFVSILNFKIGFLAT